VRVVFDKNVPIGVRRFLEGHDVMTFQDVGWPSQLENGMLLKAAEDLDFDAMVTSDQNIRYQQNLTGRKLALVVLGSKSGPLSADTGQRLRPLWGRLARGPFSSLKCLYRSGRTDCVSEEFRGARG
jgi:hypothetical protein